MRARNSSFSLVESFFILSLQKVLYSKMTQGITPSFMNKLCAVEIKFLS